MKEFVFINYCGQKIGQFNKQNLGKSLSNAIVFNLSLIISIPFEVIYLLFFPKSIVVFVVIYIVVTYLLSNYVKQKVITRTTMNVCELRYKTTSKKVRILFFMLSILFVILSVVAFSLSMVIPSYFK